MNLKDLSTERQDHTIGVKTYAKNVGKFFIDFPDFCAEYMSKDVDDNPNLVFKWDLVLSKNDNSYYLDLLIYSEKEGSLTFCKIQTVVETDIPQIIELLRPSYERLKNIWLPLSGHFITY